MRTYLRHKRRHILDNTPHRHLLVVPGQRDDLDIEADGRGMTVTIASPKVPGSPHYRLIRRNWAVQSVLAEHRPDLIECQDVYNLPWAAIGHAAIPTHRPGGGLLHGLPDGLCGSAVAKWLGRPVGAAASRLCYGYCSRLYRRFDAVYAMSETAARRSFARSAFRMSMWCRWA